MTTSETHNQYGFPIGPCDRCGGSGRYSYNQRDGDRCWGCNGSGIQVERRAQDAWAAFQEHARSVRRPLISEVQVGWQIRDLNWSGKAKGPVYEVASVEMTDRVSSWRIVDGEKVDPNHIWRITSTDGQVLELGSFNHVARLGVELDPAPFLAQIKPARQR